MADDLVSLAMEDGFERSLLELAKIHDNKIGLWLTTIESEVMSTLKGSLAAAAGVSPDGEAVAAAAQQMEKFFKNFRDGIEKSEGRWLSRN
jgi:hypothetical protein